MLKPIFLAYILLPLIALLLICVMAVLKYKNDALNNKKLIVFILLASLTMGIPGIFGFSGNGFSPWFYLICQFIYLVFGVLFVQAYNVFLQKHIHSFIFFFQFLIVLVILLIGNYLFALLFNLCSETGGGYAAATCSFSFPIPLLFYWTYIAFINIPFEIFKVWQYPINTEELNFDGEDFNKLMVIELEFSRRPDDRDRVKVKAKAPDNISFGEWFRKFIDDYNQKFPNQQISFIGENGEPNGWIFYCKKTFLHRRRLLDPALSVAQNHIKEHITIVSKRVIEHAEESFLNTQNKLSFQL